MRAGGVFINATSGTIVTIAATSRTVAITGNGAGSDKSIVATEPVARRRGALWLKSHASAAKSTEAFFDLPVASLLF